MAKTNKNHPSSRIKVLCVVRRHVLFLLLLLLFLDLEQFS